MKRFKNILFARSAKHSEVALAHALTLARHNQAGLTFLETPGEIPDVSVFGLPNETVNQFKDAALKASREDMQQLARLGDDDTEVEFRTVEGIRFLTIIREVLRREHDLVVKAADGKEGLLSHLFSTTDMHLLRKCPSPLWLVKPDGSKEINRIVAAVDFDLPYGSGVNDALNKQILKMAVSLAHMEGAQLHVVHAWQALSDLPLSGMQSGMGTGIPEFMESKEELAQMQTSKERKLSKLIDGVRGGAEAEVYDAVKPEIHVIRGSAQQVIVEQTRVLDADLLIMGTVGRVGISGVFIGNTAEAILNEIDCSVLAIKPAGFKSPVTLE